MQYFYLSEKCLNDVMKMASILQLNDILVKGCSKSDGQYKKTASSDELSKYLPNFTFTSISTGLENTIKFFNDNKEHLRL